MPRFVILEKISNRNKVYLEYNDVEVLTRLKARVFENLSRMTDYKKTKYTKEQIDKALNKAFYQLTVEFKERTVTLA